LKQNPDDTRSRFELATTYLCDNRFEDAETQLHMFENQDRDMAKELNRLINKRNKIRS
jgi:thioredoxin-like negative regulator of GroEL